EVLDDPAHFDVAELNRALAGPVVALADSSLDPRLLRLFRRLNGTSVGQEFGECLLAMGDPPSVAPEQFSSSLSAYQWFLDRAGDCGLLLTGAGYLKPEVVVAACTVVPTMADFPGMHNREVQCFPLLEFRKCLQVLGLLRKFKGELRLTRAGEKARGNPAVLWEHLASHLVPTKGNEFVQVASLVYLVFVGGGRAVKGPINATADALSELGWRMHDGSPMTSIPVWDLPVTNAVRNLTSPDVGPDDQPGAAARALARAAVWGSSMGTG
ncbi:MAG: plasmid pRiA4b ORF-3 family protein, partial [Angustibacter sp.]